MFVKINTREHFSILNAATPDLYANMADELRDTIYQAVEALPHNIILDLKEVTGIDEPVLGVFLKAQEDCLTKNISFVITEIQPELRGNFKETGLNTTPTVAEAIDLVMMEQLERGL